MSNLVHAPQWFGGGLGNEFFPYSKACIAAQVTGGDLYFPVHLDFVRKRSYFLPEWRRTLKNRFGIREVIYYRAEDYDLDVESTGTLDYAVNVSRFCDNLNSKKTLVVHGGMRGGFASIIRGREFVRTRLLSRQVVARRYADLMSRLDPQKLTVAIHIRRGDFKEKPSQELTTKAHSKPGRLSPGHLFKKYLSFNEYNFSGLGIQRSKDAKTKWNQQTPIGWFESAIRQISHQYGENLQFILVSDGLSAAENKVLNATLNGYDVTHGDSHLPDLDLLLLGSADALLCSTSSFSMWGAFLANSLYVFNADHLSHSEDQTLYLWDRPENDSSVDPQAGYAVGEGGVLAASFFEAMNLRQRQRDLAGQGLLFGQEISV